MTSIRKLASALCLACCFSLPSKAQDTTSVTTQTHNISDDGFANVPLQFDFPYYGLTFNNSWMFSNGIISFQDPNASGLAWSNLGVRQFSTTMGSQFDYSIYPLWTDLINIGGTFRTEGNAEFQRYSWLGISPFYDANRLNTFSVEIRPDGSISANYTLIDVNYASVGTVGNSSAGEFDQIFFSGSTVNTGSISNWERYTLGAPPPVEEPQQQQFEVVTETPMVVVVESNTGVEATPIVQSTQPATQQTEQAQAEQSSGSGISLSRILNIVSREQARVATLERSVTESSVEQSISQALQVTEQAESTSLSIALQESQSGGTAESNFSSIDLTSSSSSASISSSSFSATDILNQDSNVSREENQQEQKRETVNRNAPNNELAEGVTIASLGAVPAGFQAYSITMPDGSFYAPKEIYRNQRVIDNPSSRRMFGGSDAIHQQMVDQQYKGN
jgi:hypothetical protein